METSIFNDIQRALTDKRMRLNEWHRNASKQEKQVVLGTEGEPEVQAHLHVIGASLEKVDEGTLGVCVVCHEQVDTSLLQMDYTSCICLDHFSPEERRQLESELELSQVVQRAMLPQTLPSIPGADLAAFSRPAQIVGGDYFDFLQFRDGSHGFVVADVSGHGVSAGMLMTSLQTAFHTLVPEAISPTEVLERINRLYIHNIKFTTFVTIFFGRLDLHTRTFSYVNAGHNPALLYKGETGEVQRLSPTGAAIGLVEHFNGHIQQVELCKGDILLLYTDGITEAVDSGNRQFGEERLVEVLKANSHIPAEGILQAIRQVLNDFTGGRSPVDDTTLIAFKPA